MIKSLGTVLNTLLINESIANKDLDRALDIIDSYLNKYKIYSVPFNEPILVNNAYIGANLWCDKNNNAASILWKQNISSTEIDSVAFFDNATEWFYVCKNGGDMKANVVITANGASTSKFIEIIKKVMLGEIKMDQKAIEKELKDYKIYESYNVNEETLDDLDRAAKQLRRKARKFEIGSAEWDAVQQQLNEIKRRKQVLRSTAVRANVPIVISAPIETKEEKQFEEEVNWKERYEDMEVYVNMVLDGVKPLAVICGNTGIGKSYRTMELAKKHGKVLSKGGYKALGENWCLLKGSQTTVSLYQNLFQYRDKGDLIMLDDCDSILRDIDAVNIIKAATDSGDERIVAYGTSRPPEVPEMLMDMHPEWENICIKDSKGRWHYPQAFEYKGSMIILTNMRSGQLDTAIKNRAILADLNFSNEQMLEIIKEMMDTLKNSVLTKESKEKAYKFLEKMVKDGEDMEISLRSFETCAEFYVRCKDSKAVERRVRDQMRLQYSRGGKRY